MTDTEIVNLAVAARRAHLAYLKARDAGDFDARRITQAWMESTVGPAQEALDARIAEEDAKEKSG